MPIAERNTNGHGKRFDLACYQWICGPVSRDIYRFRYKPPTLYYSASIAREQTYLESIADTTTVCQLPSSPWVCTAPCFPVLGSTARHRSWCVERCVGAWGSILARSTCCTNVSTVPHCVNTKAKPARLTQEPTVVEPCLNKERSEQHSYRGNQTDPACPPFPPWQVLRRQS